MNINTTHINKDTVGNTIVGCVFLWPVKDPKAWMRINEPIYTANNTEWCRCVELRTGQIEGLPEHGPVIHPSKVVLEIETS